MHYLPSTQAPSRTILVGLAAVFASTILCFSLLDVPAVPSFHLSPEFLRKHLPSYALRSARQDYFAGPGMLQIDRNIKASTRQARWIPYQHWDELESKGMTGLEEEIRLGDGFDILQDWQKALSDESFANEAKKSKQFSFFTNKTLVLLGDSVDRGTSDDICDMLRGTRSLRKFRVPVDLAVPGNNKLADSHHCQLPSFFGNSTIWTFMIYGSTSTEDTFDHSLAGVHSRTLEARYKLIARSLERAAVKPDIILMHQQMWDLNVVNVERAKANLPVHENLDFEYLSKIRTQLHSTLTLAEELFPHAIKLFRLLHITKADTGFWWPADLPKDAEHTERTPYAINKGEQLNTVVRQVIPQFGIQPFDLGRVLQGYQGDYRDSIHIGHVGHLVYLQMLLYWMKELEQ